MCPRIPQAPRSWIANSGIRVSPMSVLCPAVEAVYSRLRSCGDGPGSSVRGALGKGALLASCRIVENGSALGNDAFISPGGGRQIANLEAPGQ